MAEIVKDLGVATAYGYAKANGYTGTEEEFGVLMASYATVADEAAASAAAASASADDSSDSAAEAAQKVLDAAAQVALATEQAEAAASKATEASGYATDASGSATDAETYKTQAQGFSQDAGADAALALGYKNAAQTYAGNAETSATNAADSASAASTSATNASTSATNAANSATAAAASATSAAESAAHLVIDDELSTESENAVQNKLITSALETKAEVDGAYEQMTVGNAEQLVSNVGIEDSVPYNFRTSGGSADIGDREVDKIVGGTLAFNQLVNHGNMDERWVFSNSTGSYSNNVITFTASAQGGFARPQDPQHVINGHKYFGTCDVKGTTAFSARIVWIGAQGKWTDFNATTSWASYASIQKADTSEANYYPRILDRRESNWDAVQIRNCMFIDLTQMFGSTIADYIYSLEQSTAGAGVAWFRKLFPKPYYAYNAGELMSVQTSAHKMVGFNAWDEEWGNGIWNSLGEFQSDPSSIASKGKIKVLPETRYYFLIPSYVPRLIVRTYDADENFVKTLFVNASGIFTTPSDCHYITFCTYTADNVRTYSGGICFNLSWDGERDGEYEAYSAHEYALDSDLTLRGIPKLSAANDLYYDGDEYESDGSVTRKYGIVDLGTIDWNYVTSGSTPYFRSTYELSGMKPSTNNAVVQGMVCAKYMSETWAHVLDSTGYDKTICEGWAGKAYLAVYDTAYNDAAAFKTAMSGVYLVYELAEPTTESADPFTNPQIVDDFGTEEYVDYLESTGVRDVAIPVGHNTFYQANLKAKLEMAPNSPDGDGDYVVRQTNGQNEYVPLLFPASSIPAAPSEDGNYTLTVTVSNGTATYSWVANS